MSSIRDWARFALVWGASLSLWTAGCTPAATGIAYGTSDSGPSRSQRLLLEEELAPYRQKGESAISGRVFLATPNGEVVGARNPVHLTPATDYAKALVQQEVVRKNEMLDRKAEEIWWTTRAGRDGRFHFSWLPAGDYVILSEVAYSPDGGTSAEIAVAYALVRVRDDEHVQNIVVTRNVQR